MVKLMLAVVALLSASAFAYNSLAPHTNGENTDFWNTTGYNVEPASSAAGVCATSLNRLVRTEAASNEIEDFRRLHVIGLVIVFH